MLHQPELDRVAIVELEGLALPSGRKVPVGVPEEELLELDGQLEGDRVALGARHNSKRPRNHQTTKIK